jgi:hypothetical protein
VPAGPEALAIAWGDPAAAAALLVGLALFIRSRLTKRS